MVWMYRLSLHLCDALNRLDHGIFVKFTAMEIALAPVLYYVILTALVGRKVVGIHYLDICINCLINVTGTALNLGFAITTENVVQKVGYKYK